MKRRNAILLGAAFLLVLAGYVAWCWRGFYLSPELVYHDSFINTPQARSLVEKWQAEHAGWDDVPFDGRRAVKKLVSPWYGHPGSTIAYLEINSDARIECRLYGRNQIVEILRWEKTDGTWGELKRKTMMIMY